MPACPKCGYPAATPLNCPACKTIFSKPLSLDNEPNAATSPALQIELPLDRRSVSRTSSAVTPPRRPLAPKPANPPAAGKPKTPVPASGWLFEAHRSPPGVAIESIESSESNEPGDQALPKPPTALLAIETDEAAATRPMAIQAIEPLVGPLPVPTEESEAANEPNSIIRQSVEPVAGDQLLPMVGPAEPSVLQPSEPMAIKSIPLLAEIEPFAPPDAAFASNPVVDLAPNAASDPEPRLTSEPDQTVPAPVAADPAFAQLPRSSKTEEFEPARAVEQELPAGVREIHARPAAVMAQLGAWLVDAAVLGALFGIYLWIAQMIAGRIPPVPAASVTGGDRLMEHFVSWRGLILPGLALLLSLIFAYCSLFHALGGRTIGKRLFGLTLVDATGFPPRLPVAALRTALSFISAALCMMGFVLVLFDARRQSLHDKLTRTFVVRLTSIDE